MFIFESVRVVLCDDDRLSDYPLYSFVPLETLLRLQRLLGVSHWYRGVPSPQNIKRVFKD